MPERPDALAGHRVLSVRSNSGQATAWLFRRASNRGVTSWEPSAQVWVSDPEALVDLALAGAGIAQIGLHHAGPFLRSGRLKILLHDCHDPGLREILLHYPHRQFLSTRVRVVVDALLEHFKGHPDLQLDPGALPTEWLG